ncbi:MAG: thiamine diphosphokinase [Desulfitobacterium sp.]
MNIAVVANGEWDQIWGKRELSTYDRLIAADGGANRIMESGYLPDAVVGDLDSIKAEYLESCRQQGVRILSYPCEKDETDLELALDYAAKISEEEGIGESSPREIKEIFLLGATGGRIDHLLGNLSIMHGFLKRGLRIRMKDPHQELWLLASQKKLTGLKGQKLSIIPVTEKAVVRTEGLYYPLHQEVLHQDSPRGISNVFLGDEALIDVSSGTVAVVILRSDFAS